MSTLTIHTVGDRTSFAPRDKVEGEVRWQLDKEVTGLELCLEWRTEGKGTSDNAVVDRLTVEQPAASGQRAFALTLPAGPLSYSGRLISVVWSLKVVVLGSRDVQQLPLVVSPFGVPIQMGDAGSEAKT